MNSDYILKDLCAQPTAAASQNACKLCSPLGAALVFKGIAGAVPLLHGSQGCSTYIRRYLISHYKEPIDIACSNFGEQTAIFGGGANLKLALDNIIAQYSPRLIGVATTCLAETIGDDVPMFIREYQKANSGKLLPPIVNVSTPSYQGTHMQGFHRAVLATVRTLARNAAAENPSGKTVSIFPGMVSPADLRYLKDIVAAFGLKPLLLPDYSKTLDGGLWSEYQRIPDGGTPVEDIIATGNSLASIEMGKTLTEMEDTAATYLERRHNVPAHRLGLPMGIRHTDHLMQTLAAIAGNPLPVRFAEERARLLDALVDGHKYVNGVRAAVYGEIDLVLGMVALLLEIGILPVVCATGDNSGRLDTLIKQMVEPRHHGRLHIFEDADFADIEDVVRQADPDVIFGHSKGYGLARKLGIPLIRIGFPIHDRVGGSRLIHLGYQGTQALFDRIANTIIENKQMNSKIGYTYM